MWIETMLGTDLYHLVLWFIVYSFLGWLVESIYMSICNRKITNRGFMKGPFCPIYGFGALLAYFILRPLEGNYFLLYLAGAILATAFEFLVGKLMLRFFGELWWDYKEKPFNYKGILCLESTLAWGLYTLILFGFLQKLVVGIMDRVPAFWGIRGAVLILGICALDMLYHILSAKSAAFDERMEGLKQSIRARWF